MVGTQSKLGKRYPVKAFETGERVTIEYLNGYLMDKSKAVTDFHYKSDLSLAEARKKYPEWYEKRIVQGERRERWHIKRDLSGLFPIAAGEAGAGEKAFDAVRFAAVAGLRRAIALRSIARQRIMPPLPGDSVGAAEYTKRGCPKVKCPKKIWTG